MRGIHNLIAVTFNNISISFAFKRRYRQHFFQTVHPVRRAQDADNLSVASYRRAENNNLFSIHKVNQRVGDVIFSPHGRLEIFSFRNIRYIINCRMQNPVRPAEPHPLKRITLFNPSQNIQNLFFVRFSHCADSLRNFIQRRQIAFDFFLYDENILVRDFF